MKGVATLFIVVLAISAISWREAQGQTCYEDGVVFDTQESIDSFPIQFPDCTDISGNVTIAGSDVISLQGLHNIRTVRILKIENTSLQSLSGLDSLYCCHDLSIYNNDSLTDVLALQALSLCGYGGVSIKDNDALEHLYGISLRSVDHQGMSIQNNSKLIDLNGLDSLHRVFGGLGIVGNNSLVSLEGLEGLRELDNGLIISNNKLLTNLDPLTDLVSIGDLQLTNNDVLSDITSLENTFIGCGWMSIRDNPALSFCHIQSICNRINFQCQFGWEFMGNAVGCSKQDVIDQCEQLTPVLEPNEEQLYVYPNPASGSVNLNGFEALNAARVRIYNELGQFFTFQGNYTEPFDVSGLNPGHYFIEVVTGDLTVYRAHFIKS